MELVCGNMGELYFTFTTNLKINNTHVRIQSLFSNPLLLETETTNLLFLSVNYFYTLFFIAHIDSTPNILKSYFPHFIHHSTSSFVHTSPIICYCFCSYISPRTFRYLFQVHHQTFIFVSIIR